MSGAAYAAWEALRVSLPGREPLAGKGGGMLEGG